MRLFAVISYINLMLFPLETAFLRQETTFREADSRESSVQSLYREFCMATTSSKMRMYFVLGVYRRKWQSTACPEYHTILLRGTPHLKMEILSTMYSVCMFACMYVPCTREFGRDN